MLKKFFSIILILSLVLTQSHIVYGQNLSVPLPTEMLTISPAYQPCVLTGIQLNQNNPFQMNFIVDVGDSHLEEEELSLEIQKLVHYFLASLTIPEKDMWVNLSPYENNRIIEEHFGRTQMGRDLLSLDYVLKQLTSALMHPDSDLGKKFWDEIYRRSFEQYGTTDIPIDAFNKVWITPKHALIYEDSAQEANNMTAFIHQGTLQVMLESDYLASLEEKKESLSGDENALNEAMVQDVIRSVILPVLETEVNEGEHFSELRQIYHSLLLATWLKKRLSTTEMKILPNGNIQTNPLSLMFMDQQKTQGVDIENPAKEKQDIYNQYLKAFQQGAYGFIKEEMDIYSQEMIPRKYFSGGVVFATKETTDYAQRPKSIISTLKTGLLIAGVSVGLNTASTAFATEVQSSYSETQYSTSISQGEGAFSEETQEAIEGAANKIRQIDNLVTSKLIIERFEKKRNGGPGLNIQEIFDKVDVRFTEDQSLQEVWGTSQALKEAVIIIAYLESSFGFTSSDFWQVKPPLRTEIEKRRSLFTDIQIGDKNKRAYHYDFALANIYWLSDLINRFYPTLTVEEKQVLVIMGYNHGQTVIKNAKGIDLLLGLTAHGQRLIDFSKTVKGKPYQNNDEQSYLYGARFALACLGYIPQWDHREDILKRSGYPMAPKGFSVHNVSPEAFARYLQDGEKGLISDLQRPWGHFIFLENPLIDRVMLIAHPKHRDAKGNDQGTIAGAFDLSRDEYPLKSLTSQVRRQGYSKTLSLEAQVRRVLLLNGIVPPKAMQGMSYEKWLDSALKRNPIIYYPHPEEMLNPTPLFEDELSSLILNQPSLLENFPYLSLSWAYRIQQISFYNDWNLKEEIDKRIPVDVQETAIQEIEKSLLQENFDGSYGKSRQEAFEKTLFALNTLSQERRQAEEGQAENLRLEIKPTEKATSPTWGERAQNQWNGFKQMLGGLKARWSKKESAVPIAPVRAIPDRLKPALEKQLNAMSTDQGEVSQTINIKDFESLANWNAPAKQRLWDKLVNEKYIVQQDNGEFIVDPNFKAFPQGVWNDNVSKTSIGKITEILLNKKSSSDPAARTVVSDSAETVGGIDLNMEHFEMMIENANHSFEFEMTLEEMHYLQNNVTGLIPSIDSIQVFSATQFIQP